MFVLHMGCSQQLSSMHWKARGPVVPGANKPVGNKPSWASPTQQPSRAPLDLTRPWCVRVWDLTGYRELNNCEVVSNQYIFLGHHAKCGLCWLRNCSNFFLVRQPHLHLFLHVAYVETVFAEILLTMFFAQIALS